MIQVLCGCGGVVDAPSESNSDLLECPHCQRALRVIGSGAPPFPLSNGILVIAEGPDRIGEQLVLVGNGPIEVGADAGNAISLPGDSVSQCHCRLVRSGERWRVEDLTVGTLTVNDAVTAHHELQRGDVLRVGEFELEYVGAPSPLPKESKQAHLPNHLPSQTFSTLPPSQSIGKARCPSCGRSLPFDAKICVECGIDLKTGRPLLTARDVDENALYARAETAIRAISWVLPFGLYPVASEAFGTRRPFVIWAIALLTVVATVRFWNSNLDADGSVERGQNLMLWVGNSAVVASPNPHVASPPTTGEFHPWQLLTYAFLDDGVLQLAENLLFLLVLGSRVNSLVGQLKMGISYALLVVATGAVYLAAEAHRPLHPIVGSAGAIMGLAGTYLTLFPAHRVHTAAWVRTGLSSGFQLAQNVFAVPGFVVVVFYLALDAFLTLLRGGNSSAAWLHFGGFVVGLGVGLALLFSRVVDARGGDVLSMSLGTRAWLLIGKPGQRPRRDPK